MADFYGVWRDRGSVNKKLQAMLEGREAARKQELAAATDIERVYRGKVDMALESKKPYEKTGRFERASSLLRSCDRFSLQHSTRHVKYMPSMS